MLAKKTVAGEQTRSYNLEENILNLGRVEGQKVLYQTTKTKFKHKYLTFYQSSKFSYNMLSSHKLLETENFGNWGNG